jgi:hypothetical protein
MAEHDIYDYTATSRPVGIGPEIDERTAWKRSKIKD